MLHVPGLGYILSNVRPADIESGNSFYHRFSWASQRDVVTLVKHPADNSLSLYLNGCLYSSDRAAIAKFFSDQDYIEAYGLAPRNKPEPAPASLHAADHAAGLVPLRSSKKVAPDRVVPEFPARGLTHWGDIPRL
jgi:hypothetical protein